MGEGAWAATHELWESLDDWLDSIGERRSLETGVRPDFIRLSIGPETVEDLIEDLDPGIEGGCE